MEKGKYQQIQNTLFTVGAILADLDIAGFIDAIDRSETVGFLFMNPIDYMIGTDRIQYIKAIAIAAGKYQAAVIAARENLK